MNVGPCSCNRNTSNIKSLPFSDDFEHLETLWQTFAASRRKTRGQLVTCSVESWRCFPDAFVLVILSKYDYFESPSREGVLKALLSN